MSVGHHLIVVANCKSYVKECSKYSFIVVIEDFGEEICGCEKCQPCDDTGDCFLGQCGDNYCHPQQGYCNYVKGDEIYGK